MVGPQRSLITRVYVYAIAVLVLSFVAVFFVGRAMVDEGQVELLKQFGNDQVAFIGREAEATMKTRPAPDAARLDDLSRSLHVDLTFVPWTETGAYPKRLATEKTLSRPGDRPGRWQRDHWVRLDVNGAPQGALKVEFNRPRPPRGGGLPELVPGRHRLPLTAALTWMGLLALIIVPALWFWVLRPLRRMVAVADRLGHGDLSTPVPIDRKDEFGELELAFESLRQRVQQMLTARERLLRDISHELRAPLSRMAIAVSLLRDDRPSPYLDQIERDMATMDGLIGEVLALARGRSPEAMQQETVDLAEIVSGLLADRALVLAQRPTPLETRLASAPVIGDRRLLARAMGNLIDNALKYTPDTAPIRLETDVAHDRSVFRVVDRGPGIPAADLGQIFEPFYRPDTSRSRDTGGTGLGLAIAKAIAEGHQGVATLRSTEGGGTTAELNFPTATAS